MVMQPVPLAAADDDHPRGRRAALATVLRGRLYVSVDERRPDTGGAA